MKHILYLRCMICGKQYSPDEVDYVCPDHGADGTLDVTYDYDYLKSVVSRESVVQTGEMSMWRYRPVLPIPADAELPPIQIGWTPLYKTERLAAELGLKHVWVKDDGRNPTASFKDRASAIAVVKGRVKGAEVITTASTGNAAAALSGICASVGQRNVIFVPRSAPPAKIAQLNAFGSEVMLVDGSYDDAFALCLEAADHYGWYNRNTGFNPYMSEGKKTVSYEIAEQLTWQAPDVVLVSVGDGCIIGGVHKGFKDLLALGWIEKMPRIIGVQAEGSSYITQAWRNKEDIVTKPAVDAQTIADSISAGLPRDRIKALAAVVETDGVYLTVTDEEILAAIPALARGAAVFAEPAGATAYAGLIKATEQNLVSADERIVVINTGSGLKDVASAMRAVEQVGTTSHVVAPSLDALQAIFG